jgi:hypothetical protein
MTVVTKSYAPDFELCSDLQRSVREFTPETVSHHIIVPRSDLALFRRLAGPRTYIRCDLDFLPRSFVPLPFGNFALNLGRPLPPVRGWILQQVVKLAAVASSQDEVVLVADSDVEFVRPFTAESFLENGVVRFYRRANVIDERLQRHIIWHRVARTLLGLPSADPPYNDYISCLLACNPSVVRSMLARVNDTTGSQWATAIARQLHFSEWTLYGVYVDAVAGLPHSGFASDDPKCLVYWDEIPLDDRGMAEFLQGVRPTDVAAAVSAKSRTPLAIRREAFAARRARAAAVTPAPGRGIE